MLKAAVHRTLSSIGLEVRRKGSVIALAPWQDLLAGSPSMPKAQPNVLERFFEGRTEGRGIWKWRHYFEVYDRHFQKFVGRDVHVLEIGIYSGGSLEMWKHYFGPKAHIYGLDLEPACKCYEDQQTKIFIGDQADPLFWERFKAEVPALDIVVDDGGHEAHQQIATLEALLPHLRPGGIFLCEDIMSENNQFSDYLLRFAAHLHAYHAQANFQDLEARVTANPTPFQRAVHSIHLYPMVAVVERRSDRLEMVAPKHGTQWQPFLT